MQSNSGHANLIPGASKPRRVDTYVHFRFIVWAMQKDIDSITVRAVKDAMHVSKTTAQRLREQWLNLTATRFYHDSVPDIINVQRRIYGLVKTTKAANDV